jgi:F-box/WD-40 domain protein MET30
MDQYYKMVSPSLPSSYVCDTLPAPRLASSSSDPELRSERSPSPSTFEVTEAVDIDKMEEEETPLETPEELNDAPTLSQPGARKLCVRHQRMADEGTNLKLQQVSTFIVMTVHVFLCKVWLFLATITLASGSTGSSVFLHNMLTIIILVPRCTARTRT